MFVICFFFSVDRKRNSFPVRSRFFSSTPTRSTYELPPVPTYLPNIPLAGALANETRPMNTLLKAIYFHYENVIQRDIGICAHISTRYIDYTVDKWMNRMSRQYFFYLSDNGSKMELQLYCSDMVWPCLCRAGFHCL